MIWRLENQKILAKKFPENKDCLASPYVPLKASNSGGASTSRPATHFGPAALILIIPNSLCFNVFFMVSQVSTKINTTMIDYLFGKNIHTQSGLKLCTSWLVVWNIFMFPYIGNVIIPTDEVHHFSEGWLNHQPDPI